MTLAAKMIQIARGVSSRRRNWWFRALGVQIDGRAWLRNISIPRDWHSIRLADGVALDDHVVLLCTACPSGGGISIGNSSYINRFTMIDASIAIMIGRNCMIGPHCYITDHDHGFAPGMLVRDQPLRGAATTIGDNVWIGAGAIILKGVTIGDNAVVAAGAIVTSAVAPGEVVAGVPARQQRMIADAG